MKAEDVKQELEMHVNAEKAVFFPKFFKTGKGEYSEGDIFIGVTVPNQRLVAKKFRDLDFKEVETLLDSPIHEHRLTGLFILTYQFEKGSKEEFRIERLNKENESKGPIASFLDSRMTSKKINEFYLDHLYAVNNWDLVDASAYKILGQYLFENPDESREVLYRLAKSEDIWERRVAMVSTLALFKHGEFREAVDIAEILVNDTHDLIQKAVGWMLREMGKVDKEVLITFLEKHHKTMPRTALRYAIEKMSKEERMKWMRG